MRIRVAGLIEMENGYALMHRLNVKKKENTSLAIWRILCISWWWS